MLEVVVGVVMVVAGCVEAGRGGGQGRWRVEARAEHRRRQLPY